MTNNLSLTVKLMVSGIISVKEWDRQMAFHIKENLPSLDDSALQFFENFLTNVCYKEKLYALKDFENIVAMLQSTKSNDRIQKYLGNIILDLQGGVPLSN